MSSVEGGWLRAGTVASPHGLDGSFHVVAASPLLLDAGIEVQVGGVARRIVRRAGHDRRVILRLEGCETRSDAEALRGSDLLVPRDRAPGLGPDEWWPEELEGCDVVDGERAVGVVRRLLALPSCEVLEVERCGGGGELLVPLVGDAVRTVDVGARRIDVDLEFLGESGTADEGRPEFLGELGTADEGRPEFLGEPGTTDEGQPEAGES